MAFSTDLPDQTLLLDHQIAGHLHMHGKLFTGMLLHSDGYVMKPVQDNDRGEREIKFYEDVWKAEDEIIARLQKLIPKFLGLHKYDSETSVQYFIKMENVADGFKKPCIADVKIGRQTWDPCASPHKILSEMAKYEGTKHVLGFCIPGICVHEISSGKTLKFDKQYGRSLNLDTVKDAICLYLNGNSTSRININLVSEFIRQLHEIRNWFLTQRHYFFYATSILLAYDASVLEDSFTGSSSHAVRVRMIDFAHVHPADGLQDSNYIHGLENLIRIFEVLREENKPE